MNKKPLSRFFNLNLHHDGGFTLVELIVVIAILAILAAVAIPVYSGYIKKAESAGDQQLLDSINSAFASACMTNGYDHTKTTGTTLYVQNGKIAEVEGSNIRYGFTIQYQGAEVSAAVAQEIVNDFAILFAGNENTAFKGNKIYGLKVNDQGLFEISDDAVVTLKGYISVSSGDMGKIQDSPYAEMGAEDMLDMVDTNANVVSGMGTYNALVTSGVLEANAYALLGMEYGDFVSQELAKLMETDPEYASLTNPKEKAEWKAEKTAEIKATTNRNLMVLLTAKDAKQAGVTILSDLTTSADPKGMLVGNLTGTNNSDKTMGLSQTALTYGLYTAYMQGAGKTTDEYDAVTMLTDLDNPNSGFFTYLNGKQAEKDLEGLLAAMNMIDSQSTGIKQDVVANGFNKDTNGNLYDSLTELLGKG